MVSNITEVSRPTQWKPGQSGNLNGRPVGTRQAFSAGFLRDVAEVWSEEGRETMVKTARTNPAAFCYLCPTDPERCQGDSSAAATWQSICRGSMVRAVAVPLILEPRG